MAQRTRCRRSFAPLAAFMLGWLVSMPALADNPGYDRPGYGFTPVVLGAGDVTLEQGLGDWNLDRQDDIRSSLFTADSLLRVGIGGPLELQLGGSTFNYLQQTGSGTDFSSHGHGDSNLAIKLALPSSNQAFTWGLLGSVEFTDGAKAFRNDDRQYLFGAQFNYQLNERNQLGAYLQDVRAGGNDSTTVALSDNVALTKTLTAYVEAALLHAPDQGSGTVAGGGLAWMVSPRVQLDAGFDRRLDGAAPEWQANLGVSIYFGH
ncbi:MAG: transporter [Rhodanobacter sp.]